MMAQKLEFRFNAKNITPISTREFGFTVGAHPNGSNGLDTAIGEVEIPSIPLPGDVYYVWTVAPISEPLWLSPREYRRLSFTSATREDYDVRVNWTGGKLQFTWQSPLPKGIDSIWITDGYSDFPNHFVGTKVSAGGMFETDNPSLSKFKVLVWYNGTVLSVNAPREVAEGGLGNVQAKPVHVYPHPANSRAQIVATQPIDELRIFDILGVEVTTVTNVGNTHVDVDLEGVAPGILTLVMRYSNGSTVTQSLVHD